MAGLYHNKALPSGTVLREWRLEEVLGVGGFGIVYRGRSLYFDEQVAIKEYFPGAISDRVDDTTVAPNDSSAEETYALGLSKFVEEAKVLWNLSRPQRHPNIVSVRSLFEIHGTAYMVMDFEQGMSLSQMLKEGRSFDEAGLLDIIRPIAQGLDRAHRGGVLHRDIKPANILVDFTGRPVLIDFGSARFESGQATSTKMTFYTPPYAAIEQYVKTFPQGPWTDIYALGVTLYECVAGRKPPEVLERLHGDADEALSAREWPGFSRTFTQAVDAAMAIKPAERPQSIPQWLYMFDADLMSPAPEESTRVAVLRDSLREAPAPAEVSPNASQPDALPSQSSAETVSVGSESAARPAAALDVEADPPDVIPVLERKAPARPGGLVLGVGVAVAVGAVAIAATIGSGIFDSKTPASPAPAALATASVPASPVGQAVGQPSDMSSISGVATDLQGLVADVRRFGRPQKEVGALTAASRKVSALVGEASGLITGPDGAQKTASLIADVDRLAFGAARAEGAALSRDAAAQLKGVQASPAWSASARQAPVVAVRRAKSNLDNAVAGISRSADARSAIAATERALAAHQAFGQAFAAAQPALVTAQQDVIRSLQARAREAATAVAARASGSKPGVFASKAKKDAFKSAQDSAAQAHTRMTEVDRVAQAALAATDLGVVDTAVAQLTGMVRELEAQKSTPLAAFKD